MIIYKTTNLVNGKFYIGKDARNKKSYYGSGLLLNKAIKKYGKENFIKETLEVCSNVDELNQREIYWIERLDSKNLNIGYNLAEGGKGGCLGCKRSKETNQKIVKMLKERDYTWGDKISDSMKGKEKSVSHKTNISKSLKDKYKNGFISPTLGIERSEKTKDKIRNSLIGGDGRNKKEIMIEGVIYETIKEASETLGISRYLINKIYGKS